MTPPLDPNVQRGINIVTGLYGGCLVLIVTALLGFVLLLLLGALL